MVKIRTLIIAVCLVLGLSSAGVAQAIVADHTAVTQFSSIPEAAIDTAGAKRALFYHQSTGNNIRDQGLRCLAGQNGDSVYPSECLAYYDNRQSNTWPYYDFSSWNWPIWPEPMADAVAKMDQFVTLVNQQQSGYQYIGMKFCYVDGWNEDFTDYRTKMENLERAYPSKTFIWATSALWGESHINCPDIQTFNNDLRAYARANNKLLFDLADIESKGNTCRVNGCEALCPDYYDGYGGGGGGHPDVEGSMAIAKGFWWLMARASGWSGVPGQNHTPVVSAGADAVVTLPAALDLSGQATDDGLPNPPGVLTLTWSKVSGPGTVIFANAHALSTTAQFSVTGAYVLRLTASDGSLSASDDIAVTVNSTPVRPEPPHNLRITSP
jgi:hypothetical protein